MNMEFFLLFIWNFMFSILVASSQARKAHLFSPHVLQGPLISSSVALSSSLSPFRSPVFSPEIRPPSISPVSSPVTTPVRQTITPSPATIMNVGEASAGLSASATATGKDYHNKIKKRLLLGVIISLFIAFSLLLCSLFWIYRQKRSKDSDRKSFQCSDVSNGLVLGPILSKFNSIKINGQFPSVIDYSMLEKATNNFSDCNIVGEGGSGCVYKACFENNLVAAVKKLDRMQDADAEKEFENEVDLLSKMQHVNVVSLLGFCVHDQRKFLAYEFMQNGSLETQLHGPSHGSMLSWHIRMKIALDTARGLEYLHEHCNPPVIHRDLKSSNILLDSNFNAKISDFGLAIIVGGQRKNNIKLSGTLGYVAPEYLLDGRVTEKSDVYAFGVVLLELLIGRKPVERTAPAQCQSIVTWAMPQLIDRSKLPNIVDPIIKDTMDLKHLYQIAAVAVLCVQPEPSYRPLITDVLHSLIPLVPMELGGALRVIESSSHKSQQSSHDRLSSYPFKPFFLEI